MNKATLINAIATFGEMTKADADKALAAVQTAISTALANGESVTIPGFGTFSVAERSARQGRNPQTGEPLEIAASRTVKFKPGKTLKDVVQAD